MAGPWFTVVQRDGDWQTMGTLWVSDGKKDGPGTIEIKLEMVENNDATQTTNLVQLVD